MQKVILSLLILTIVLINACVGIKPTESTPQVGQCWKDNYGSKCEVEIVRFRNSASGINDVADYRLLESNCDHAGKSIGISEWSYPVGAWQERFNPC